MFLWDGKPVLPGLSSHKSLSRTKPRPESQVVSIELAHLQIAEVDSIETLFNLFKSDIFTAKTSLMKTRLLCQLMSPASLTRRVWK
jgi:hypothetical protein